MKTIIFIFCNTKRNIIDKNLITKMDYNTKRLK